MFNFVHAGACSGFKHFVQPMSEGITLYMQSNSGGMTLYSLGTEFNLCQGITLYLYQT